MRKKLLRVKDVLYKCVALGLFPKNLTHHARSWSNMKCEKCYNWKMKVISTRIEQLAMWNVQRFGESFCLTKCEHVLVNIRSNSWCSDQNTACLIIKQNVAYSVHTLIRIEGHDAPYAHQFEIDSYLGETFSGHCGFCLQTNFSVGFFCFDYKLARCNKTRKLITLYICIIYNATLKVHMSSAKTIDQTHLNLKLWPYRYESKILLNIDQRNCASDIHNKLQCNSSIVFVTNSDPIVSLLSIPLLPVIFMKFLRNVLPEKSNYLQPNDNKINGVVARLVMALLYGEYFFEKCCSSCCLLWKNNIIYILWVVNCKILYTAPSSEMHFGSDIYYALTRILFYDKINYLLYGKKIEKYHSS